MRNWLCPLIVNFDCPGPVIVVVPLVSVRIGNSPCVSVSVLGVAKTVELKLIVSEPAWRLASFIATRRVTSVGPGFTVSLGSLTVYVLKSVRGSSASESTAARRRRRESDWPLDEN